jgi:hypothetical protein
MKHRNLTTQDWTRSAIDSLFDRGIRKDWEEFGRALGDDERLARETLLVCEYHQNAESAALARVLVQHLYGTDDDMGLK